MFLNIRVDRYLIESVESLFWIVKFAVFCRAAAVDAQATKHVPDMIEDRDIAAKFRCTKRSDVDDCGVYFNPFLCIRACPWLANSPETKSIY